MGIITNISDQLGISIEIIGTENSEWTKLKLKLQYYVVTDNVFHDWVITDADIFETDLSEFRKYLHKFIAHKDISANFVFEPEVEPSFRMSLQRVAVNDDHYDINVLMEIDLTHVLRMNISTTYRENRIALHFVTDERRLHEFALNL